MIMSKVILILTCGLVGSATSIGIGYGAASLSCGLVSKPADKVCQIRALGKSRDGWKVGLLGGAIVGLVVSNRRMLKFEPTHLSIVGVLVLVGATAANNKSFWFGIIRPQSMKKGNALSPRMSAFLATIRWAETGTSAKESYTKLVFNGTFNNNFATHPRIKQCAPINGRNVCSTAAGAYQMLDISWNDLAPDLGLKDFSPSSQDRMAIEYIRRNKAIRDVEAGNFEVAACKVGKIWGSFPCNNYNQNAKRLDKLQGYYNQQLVSIGG
jgi:muramidase (phage lysozyme)